MVIERLEGCKAEDLQAKAQEVLQVAKEHGWLDKRVMPYGYGIRIEEFMTYPADMKCYTTTSRQIIKAEINGLIDIMNVWLERAAEKHVTVLLPKGGEVKVPMSCLEDYLELGAVVKEGE